MQLQMTYESKNPFLRKYFYSRLKHSINLAKLNPDDIVLDLGCGFGTLLGLVKDKVKYSIGVDIDISQVKDEVKKSKNVRLIEGNITDLNLDIKPTKIFCISILEHLNEEELNRTISNIKKMSSNNAKLIVGLPTENILYLLARRLFGFNDSHGHKTNYRIIEKMLKDSFEFEKSEVIPFNLFPYIGLYVIERYRLK